MISTQELVKTIKKSYYILLALKIYCRKYENIEGFLSISYTIDLLLDDVNNTYLKIINEDI